MVSEIRFQAHCNNIMIIRENTPECVHWCTIIDTCTVNLSRNTGLAGEIEHQWGGEEGGCWWLGIIPSSPPN